ncbi:hypothetical protein FACS1894130_12550 [Spirochaetia bacterium]|nr:hypothetical protein FACS1894130_12550 [Spirochaetia bacterium]
MSNIVTDADKPLYDELVLKHRGDEAKALAELLQLKKKAKEPKISWTAAELLTTDFPPIDWIIPDLIAPGLTMLVGQPKLGKSWMVLQWAIGVSCGGGILGKILVKKTDVLYLSLEDTGRRLAERLAILKSPKLENLTFFTQWATGIIGLDKYLEEHKGTRFVIIDTLQRFSKLDRGNDYDPTYNFNAALKTIADRHGVGLVEVHHTNKSAGNIPGGDWLNGVMGSQGYSGAADSTLLLRRGRGNRNAELLVTGRDVTENEFVLTLDLNCEGWVMEGRKNEVLEGQTQQLIHDWLKENGANGPSAIFKGLKENGYEGTLATIKTILTRMASAGKLTNTSGVYMPPTVVDPQKSVNHVNLVNHAGTVNHEERTTEFTGFTHESIEKPPVKSHTPVKDDSTVIPSPEVDSKGKPETDAYTSPDQRRIFEAGEVF